ncbi:phospholipase A2 [Mycobacteroides salmoniphilum]|uniref:phospholipase A2 n=1 Tax=Mycobacteroides salmoniphilum TaxID=404941 RepID=UPI00099220C0|nr:phospholipase A2 [Mycobacteroides salmoniphilum]QCH23420.1 Prokaryotic phospholipase A2 [Mycobacteroides salmoniphilum]
MAMSDRWRMSSGLRQTSAFVAIMTLAIGGAKVASDHTLAGSGFSTVATVAADPTGPTGGGGMTGPPGGGSQFQPPGSPPQQPDYQGGINQPPLDQSNGISIYNTGAQDAPQQVGQQAGQQPQQSWDQPAHGTQPPDYSTPPGYTQGPGQPNPDFQAPQQQSPQGQQPQQGPSQAPSQQPSEAPTQTQQPDEKQEEPRDENLDQTNRDDECTPALGIVTPSSYRQTLPRSFAPRIPSGDGKCRKCDDERTKQYDRNCDTKFAPQTPVSTDNLFAMPCGYIYDPDSKATPPQDKARHDYCSAASPDQYAGWSGTVDFAYSCARHDMCYDSVDKADPNGPGLKYHGCNLAFKEDLINACNTLSGIMGGPSRVGCRNQARLYYSAVEESHK